MSVVTKKCSTEERLESIQELLRKHQQVSIPDLAERFNTSEMTIRRDLNKLVQTGHIKLTTGGARATERMAFEFDFLNRKRRNQSAKLAIGKAALQFIREPLHRFIIDTGTTTLQLARLLREQRAITIITPNMAIASEFQYCENIQTILLGGLVRPGKADLTGPVTEKALELFSVDIAFQGTDGIGLDGTIYNTDISVVPVEQKMRQCADYTYILADSSKIGKTALAKGGNLKDVDAFITDSNIKPEHYNALSDLGTKIIIAELGS